MARATSRALLLATILVSFLAAQPAAAGPIAYGICQTGCNAVAVACYAAAGFSFGTVAAPLAVPAIIQCNAALGVCMTTCIAAGCAPIP